MLETIQRTSVISFPMLGGLTLNPPAFFMLFGRPIYFYGVLIGLGFVLGILLCARRAKRFGLKEDDVYDVMIWLIPCSILGARLYYVLFQLDYYLQHPDELFAIWNGGIAIYGGVIGGILAVWLVCRRKKIPVLAMMDDLSCGLLLGQIIGRWGNFFNREVFGGYTDSLLAMKFPASMARASDISEEIAAHMTDGCIQVHPTFLYEGIWNFCLLMLLIFALKYRKFHGQIILLYLMGYGIGRALIETIRTDQLFIPGTTVPVNMVMGICVAIAALTAIVIGISRAGKKEEAGKA